MKESGIKLAVLALALIGSSAASASTQLLSGKGFNIVYTGGSLLSPSVSPSSATNAAFAASSTDLLTLASDGKTVSFNTSGLSVDHSSSLSPLSFSITLDPGYTFSNLTLTASGHFAIDSSSSTEKSTAYSGISSEIVSGGKSLSLLNSSFSSSSVPGVGEWDLSASKTLASTSFANAASLDFSSWLLLKASSANPSDVARLNVENYSLQVATVPVPEPEQWMMMLAGIGMLGTIIGRRARG